MNPDQSGAPALDPACVPENDSISEIWAAFRDAIVEIVLPDGPIVVGPRAMLATQELPFPPEVQTPIHVITAENPNGDRTDAGSNASAMDALTADARKLGSQVLPARGGNLEWTHTEKSVATIGLTDTQAVDLGRKYGQLAIFCWTSASWSLLDCANGDSFSYAWGATSGSVDTLHARPDFAELTQWSESQRMTLVTWDEVRDHLKQRLMMDEEWLVEGDDELTWWPSPLPLRVAVVDEGEFPNGDNVLRISAETEVAFTDDEALGLQLASQFRHRYPTGTLVYENGALRICTAIALNPLSRSVLSAFHESVLIQAAVALELAGEWAHVNGLHWLDADAFAHPVSGPRADVDELVTIYGPSFRKPTGNPRLEDETRYVWDVARDFVRERLANEGWLEGFSNEEVDFYYAPDDNLVELAVGVDPDDWRVEKFGLGLSVWARLLPAGVAFDDHDANLMNIAFMRNFMVSAHGHITGGPDEEERGSIVSAYLPLNVWAEYAAHGSESMAVTVGNYVRQCAYVSRTFRNWFQESAQEAGKDR